MTNWATIVNSEANLGDMVLIMDSSKYDTLIDEQTTETLTITAKLENYLDNMSSSVDFSVTIIAIGCDCSNLKWSAPLSVPSLTVDIGQVELFDNIPSPTPTNDELACF